MLWEGEVIWEGWVGRVIWEEGDREGGDDMGGGRVIWEGGE